MNESLRPNFLSNSDGVKDATGLEAAEKNNLNVTLLEIESLTGLPQEGNVHVYTMSALRKAQELAALGDKDSISQAHAIAEKVEGLVRDHGTYLNINYDTTYTEEMLPIISEVSSIAAVE